MNGTQENGGSSYRLIKLQNIEGYLADESKREEALRRKYSSRYNKIGHVNTAAAAGTTFFVVGGAVSVGTGVGVVAAAPLSAVAAALSITVLITNGLRKRMQKKMNKHEQLSTLASKQLDTVSILISKALIDNKISEEELESVLAEQRKYNEEKSQIRKKFQDEIDAMEAKLNKAIHDEVDGPKPKSS